MATLNDQQWERVQDQVFTNWVNALIGQNGKTIGSIRTDLTPEIFKDFAEMIVGKEMDRKLSVGGGRIYALNNYSEILDFLRQNSIDVGGCSAENMTDVENGYKYILGMMFSMYRSCCISRGVGDDCAKSTSSTPGKIEAMVWNWANQVINPYGLYIDNPSTSFADGKILLALVDSFMQNEVYKKFEDSSNEKRVQNAIDMARDCMGIDQLFGVDEIINCQTDNRAMMLYISLFSQVFKAKEILENQPGFYSEKQKENIELLQKQQQELEEKDFQIRQQQQQFEEEKNQMAFTLQQQMEQQKLEHLKHLDLIKQEQEQMRFEQEQMRLEQERTREEQLQKIELDKQRIFEEQQAMRQQQQEEKVMCQQELEQHRQQIVNEQQNIRQQNIQEQENRLNQLHQPIVHQPIQQQIQQQIQQPIQPTVQQPLMFGFDQEQFPPEQIPSQQPITIQQQIQQPTQLPMVGFSEQQFIQPTNPQQPIPSQGYLQQVNPQFIQGFPIGQTMAQQSIQQIPIQPFATQQTIIQPGMQYFEFGAPLPQSRIPYVEFGAPIPQTIGIPMMPPTGGYVFPPGHDLYGVNTALPHYQ